MRDEPAPGALASTALDEGGECGALLQAVDWSAHPLGAPEGWPQSLRTTVSLMLRSAFPMFVAWGERQTFLYNDAYATILGDKHPSAMARPFKDIWGEIWTDIEPLITRALSGQSTWMENLPLTIRRSGEDEQAWFTFSYSPVTDDGGLIAGMFCAVVETTQAVQSRRQAEQASAKAARLAAAIEQARQPILLSDPDRPDNPISFANPAFSELTGYSIEEVIGRNCRFLQGPGADPETVDRLRAAIEAQREITVELLNYRKDGSAFWNQLTVSPVHDDTGRLVHYLSTQIDVTARRQAEEALRKSEEQARAVVAGASDYAIFTTDTAGLVTNWFEGAERVFGWSAAEIVGRPSTLIFLPDDVAAGVPQQELAVAARTGCGNDERWHLRKDGGRVFMSGSVRPLHSDGATIRGFLKIARDETERRLAAERVAASEKRFREIADSAPAILWTTDPEGVCTYLNQGWYDATGQAEAEALGFGWLDATHPEDAPAAGQAFVTANANQEPFRVEYRLRHADGRYRWSIDAGQPQWSADGAYLGMVGAVFDIEAQKRTEAALRESQADYAAAAELNPQVAWTAQPDGQLDRVAERWREWTGVSGLGESWGESLHPDDLPPTVEAWTRSVATGHPYDVEHRVMRTDGQVRWARSRAYPRWQDGRIVRWYGATEDVHERKVAELELQALNARLEAEVEDRTRELQATEESLRQAQKMEAIGQLTGGIAHDFNNLLTGIIGSLDLIKRRIDAGRVGEIARFMDAAVTSANRAAALTHRLLAFARRQSLDTKATDVNQLAASMEDLLHRTLGEQVQLKFELGAGIWQASTDANQLESALLNLAINARDAMPDGGQLTVETANTTLDGSYTSQHEGLTPGEFVVICVTDTGTGMPADVMERAFDPFFTTKPIGQGTGLGLSMIYGFARQTGGHARLYSEVGQGTTVKLYLPRHLGEGEAVQAADTGRDLSRGQGETVLVVEDEPAVRLLVTELLGELGYRVLEAHDGPAALPFLDGLERIDLMVSDVGLPGLNGRQLAEAARQRRPGLKVLFITGYAENAAVRSGFLDPGMEMITKPFAVEALATKVREMLAGD